MHAAAHCAKLSLALYRTTDNMGRCPRDSYIAGFVVNEEKSVWEPTQVLDWLGMTWNSLLRTLKIVERRITKIINTIDRIREADFKVSARQFASFRVKLFLLSL